jgi:hypothetical protein
MDCLDVDKLDPTIFNDVCVATDILHNVTAFSIVQSALKTCCGSDNVFTTDDACYTYCNITTPFDTVMLNNCLLDTLDTDTSDSINYDCFPLAWELSSTMDTTAGKIATTWTYPDQTVTVTETNGAVKTETFDYSGNLLTGTAASSGSAATKTTGTMSTSTTASLTSPATPGTTSTGTIASPTSSKSSGGPRIGLSYKTGILVTLSVLGLVL